VVGLTVADVRICRQPRSPRGNSYLSWWVSCSSFSRVALASVLEWIRRTEVGLVGVVSIVVRSI
jgi:hypothetical protein